MMPRRTKMLISSLFAGVGGVILFASPALAADSYEVSKGDTLSEIGAELNVPWQDIAKENHLTSPYIIYPDQVLRLPGDDSGNAVSGVGVRQSLKLGEETLDGVDTSIASERYGLGKHNSKASLRVASLLGPMFKLDHIGGFATSGHSPNSDHYTGHALDLGIGTIPHGHRTGNQITAYVLANREELNVKYIIWNKRIWTPGQGWYDYHGPSDHTDHVHVSLEDDGDED